MTDRILAPISTLGPIGRLPAPGTMGSLVALIAGVMILAHLGHIAIVFGLMIIFPLGYFATAAYLRLTGKHDPKEVIIDEVIGQWLVLLLMPPYGHEHFWYAAGAAFVLFRYFDIVKPNPVSLAEQIPGAAGVIADDMLAGVMAGLCLFAGLFIIHGGIYA